jgi:hypothetical protein
MKLVRVISEHKQKKSAGQIEAIVKLPNGRIVTRHIRSEQAKAEAKKSEE